MAAWLMLSQAGNKYTAAQDKTFTLVLRQRLFLRLLSAYISIDLLCYAKRSHSGCLSALCHSCFYCVSHREFEDLIELRFSFLLHIVLFKGRYKDS